MNDDISKPIDRARLSALVEGTPVPASAPPPVAPASLDLEAFVARVGDLALAQEMALVFVPDAAQSIEKLRQAIAAGDREGVRRAAHALKGAASNFGTGPAVEAAARLEALGEAGDLAGAGSVFSRLEQECLALCAALERFAEAGLCAS